MALTITKLNLPMGRQAKVGVVGGHSSCRVTWTIDDFGIIGANTSNATAVVTGLVVGETTIHAYRGSGTDGPTSACSVTVLDNTYSSLTVVPDSVMLDAGTPSIGEILNLEILDTEGQVVQPINPVVWTNSDTTVVDVMGILDTMAVLKVIAGGASGHHCHL